MHQCPYCLKHKGIQSFHNSQDDMICKGCYEEQQFDKHLEKALILQERTRIKEKLQQIDLEELPF